MSGTPRGGHPFVGPGWLMLALVVLGGCGTLRTYRYPMGPQGIANSGLPPVFLEGQLPRRGLQEIEVVEAVGTGTKGSMQDVVGALQREAAHVGASAIVRVTVNCGYGQCHAYGVAVRYVGLEGERSF